MRHLLLELGVAPFQVVAHLVTLIVGDTAKLTSEP